MVTAAAPIAPSIAKGLKTLRRDFDVLGLAASEARIDVIRQAAVVQTQLVRSREMDGDESQTADAKIADIVYSTYRLLDPRRRRKLVERVHLSLMLDSVELPEKSVAALPIPAPMKGSQASPAVNVEALVPVELVTESGQSGQEMPTVSAPVSSGEPISCDFKQVDSVVSDGSELLSSGKGGSTLASVVSQVQHWAEVIWSGFHYVIRPVVEVEDVDDRASRPRQGGTRV